MTPAPAVLETRSLTTLTPLYGEDVLYSLDGLESALILGGGCIRLAIHAMKGRMSSFFDIYWLLLAILISLNDYSLTPIINLHQCRSRRQRPGRCWQRSAQPPPQLPRCPGQRPGLPADLPPGPIPPRLAALQGEGSEDCQSLHRRERRRCCPGRLRGKECTTPSSSLPDPSFPQPC